ncbi:hypothetical protein FDP22_05770 [Paroceanicella profunda]|uniref:Zinc-finger domain-containing protein n=1 Tax=Paroceanicella profunda TaxID=2579971 RepID=A0A5B8FRH8_9RHOB|nr:hypothetical protein [Paroceanicella profunda]QDL91336.1 hypothetical protein FDP22_05770 [Paroceanicella profunda]
MDSDDHLLAYMQGRLDPDAAAGFEAELAESPALRAELAALRAAAAALGAEAPPAAARAAGWDRLSRSIEAERTGVPANATRRFSPLQVAGIAAAAVLVWQLAAVPYLPGRGPAGYRPVSDTLTGPALQVAFADDAPLAQVTALLVALGATVTDGPGALGLFTLTFADDAARDAGEAALRARPELVTAVARP